MIFGEYVNGSIICFCFRYVDKYTPHSILGSVEGVPVGGNPVVDHHVYFEGGF